MSPIVYGVSKDGKYEIVSLTPDKLEQTMEVMRKSFFIDEKVSVAVELHKHPNAIKELEELTLRAMRDGCSVIAIEKETGIVAAASINKIQVPAAEGEDNYFENYEANCKEPSAKSLVRFMIEADAECDLFALCKVDCLIELMFMATLKEHRGKGLATKVMQASIDLGKRLLKGENVKVSMDEEKLELEPVPKIVSAIYTSFITQKISANVGFQKASEISYERWSFNGKTFAERIGPETPNTTVEYYRL